MNTGTPNGGLGSLTLLDTGDPTHELISDWLRSYVARPHPELGRPGAVCPFVGQALAAGKVLIAGCDLGAEPDLPRLIRVLELGIEWFRTLAPEENEPALNSLIIAFPGLTREHWHLIDDGHAALKTWLVEGGLMLGQFHPACEAPAAHNAAFPVNRAPVPLMVIRRMATHDILFLEENSVWVEHYATWLERRNINLSHPLYRRRLDQALGRSGGRE
jgi:hypothetical protein